MQIQAALDILKEDQPLVVRDKTFTPRGVDEVILETGEPVYWAYGKDGEWLSLDPQGEEIIRFEDIEEELEAEDDIVVYGGQDYEFSYEGTAKIVAEEGAEVKNFKEYEASSGEIIRLMEEESTGDVSAVYGKKLTEEDLQGA